MSQPAGSIRVEYQGRLCPELAEYLAGCGFKLIPGSPLVIRAARPERLLTCILRFLADPAMGVTRIRVSGRPLDLATAGVA